MIKRLLSFLIDILIPVYLANLFKKEDFIWDEECKNEVSEELPCIHLTPKFIETELYSNKLLSDKGSIKKDDIAEMTGRPLSVSSPHKKSNKHSKRRKASKQRKRKPLPKRNVNFTEYIKHVSKTKRKCQELNVKNSSQALLSPSENILMKTSVYSPSKVEQEISLLSKINKNSTIHALPKVKQLFGIETNMSFKTRRLSKGFLQNEKW